MEFFDCHVSYGIDIASNLLQPVRTAEEVKTAMALAGVEAAVVYRVEQYAASPQLGNQLLADDLAGQDNLYGLWAITPTHTKEMPDPQALLKGMQDKRMIGFRLFPGMLNFLPRAFVLEPWLELGIAHGIPFFINTAHGCSLEALADLLDSYPELTVILTDPNIWPNDRLLRPFASYYPHVYLDLSYMITDGGIESFVSTNGSSRLLYGSGFPGAYFGANMLMIRHAEIGDDDKKAIAAGNMRAIIRGIRYD